MKKKVLETKYSSLPWNVAHAFLYSPKPSRKTSLKTQASEHSQFSNCDKTALQDTTLYTALVE